jgi:hypothetical protein
MLGNLRVVRVIEEPFKLVRAHYLILSRMVE